ncbi:hypothetical protein Tco_0124154, partial [Tanacetum coccineum]
MPVLLISKMKDVRYHDFGLELLVPEQMWIEDVCTYDISVKYGIDHWWLINAKLYMKGLKRQKEAKTIKNRQGTKETRTRVKKQPEIKSRISPTQQRRKVKSQNE